MHNNRNCETVIIPQSIMVPTKSIIVASLVKRFPFTLGHLNVSLQNRYKSVL